MTTDPLAKSFADIAEAVAPFGGTVQRVAATLPAGEPPFEGEQTPLTAESEALLDELHDDATAVFAMTSRRFSIKPLVDKMPDRLRAIEAAARRGSLDEAWAACEAALPEGWLFHGVALADHSMEGGNWGPDWAAVMSWPGHCEYDDCDHDEAFRSGTALTPIAALIALREALEGKHK